MQMNQNIQYKKMTETKVSKLVISLGIPATISMLATNIYNMADTFFVSQLGNSASGAVGIVFGFMSILQAFGFMFGQGAGSIISRRLGQKDSKSASEYASISFGLSLIMGVVIGVLALTFLDPFLRIMGSTETILPYARSYVIYIIIAGPFMMCSFVMNNILRYEGKASIAMIGLVIGGLLNIIGDPIFIFVFDMGIAGAGLATAISQIISFLILLSIFLLGKTESKLSIRYFSFNKRKIWEIVSTGFPSMVRQGLASISTMVFNKLAGGYGDAAVAAMSIVSRINFFMFSVGLGMGQGFQPVCGFNYGAGKYSRVRQAFRFTLWLSQGLMCVMAVLGLILSPLAIGIFRDDPKVIEIGTAALRYQCIALLFQPLTVMANMTFQSTGQRVLATFTAMLRNGIYFIPILLIMTLTTGLFGIQSSQAISDVLAFVTVVPLALRFFRKLPEDVVD